MKGGNVTPLVSVIVPLYNAESYIIETLDSIKSQTYPNYEVIIVDNVSTDGSFLLVKSYIEKLDNFTLFQTKENSGGPAHPRNVGVSNSNGEYIAFLDSDDLWHPQKLELQIKCMEGSGSNFSSTSAFLINECGEALKNKTRKDRPETKTFGIKSLLFKNSIVTSSVVVKKEFLSDFRFNEDVSFITIEDYFLWLNLIYKDDCVFRKLNSDLVDYRVLDKSLGNTGGGLRFAVKGVLATTRFMIDKNREDFLFLVLFSNLLRWLKLSTVRLISSNSKP